MRKEVEVCAYSIESCRAALAAGANRVELCAAMYDGGTTPSAGAIQMAREILRGIELFVMVRPRGGDFLYSPDEFEQMRREIAFIKTMGADGIVLGVLTESGEVDVARTRELVQLAAPMKVTFHRAFDMVKDVHKALEDVVTAGCYRILTSGQKNTVEEGLQVLEELVQQANGRIRLMAGSGVNAGNALKIASTGVDALHLSGKSTRDSKMTYRNPDVFMGGVPGIPEYEIVYGNADKIKKVICILEDENRSVGIL